MTEIDYVEIKASIERKIRLIEKFGTLDSNMLKILHLSLKQVNLEYQDCLTAVAHKSIGLYWKNRYYELRDGKAVDFDEVVKTTRDVARRSSMATDAKLAHMLLEMGDAGTDVGITGDSSEERKQSLKSIISAQKK